MLVSAWNVSSLPDESISPQTNVLNGRMALAPCHVMFQCYVANGKLSLQVYQRSADLLLGVPFNIASYALLMIMLAQQANLEPSELIWTAGDVHIYNNHIPQAKVMINRLPYISPDVVVFKKPSIYDYTIDDFELQNYRCHSALFLERNV